MPTTAAPPPPTTEAPAVYKPATDQGPAVNVPVPVMPALAKEFSKEGLIAFTEYWYSTLGYAFETGDAEPMMSISSAYCKMCAAMEKMVVAGHEGVKWISGGRMIIQSPTATFKPTQTNDYQVTLTARQEQVKYFRADKTLSVDLGAKPAVADILVAVFENEGWTAITVEHLAGSKSR